DIATTRPTGAPGSALGLWRSTDDGQNWTSILAALPAADLPDLGRATIAVAPSTTSDAAKARVYLLASNRAASGRPAQKDVYRSDDGGATWTALGVNATRAPTNPYGNSGFSQANLNVLSD